MMAVENAGLDQVAPDIRGRGVSVSQCWKRSSRTKRLHSKATARGLLNTRLWRASLHSRMQNCVLWLHAVTKLLYVQERFSQRQNKIIQSTGILSLSFMVNVVDSKVSTRHDIRQRRIYFTYIRHSRYGSIIHGSG